VVTREPDPGFAPAPAWRDIEMKSFESRGSISQTYPTSYRSQSTLPDRVTASNVFGIIRLSCGFR
jgi:hypothetical protein